MDQQNNDKEKQLSESLVALFLLILSYKDDKEFKKLLVMYKQHREELKDYIGKIYLKCIKDNELNMSYQNINREIKKLENKLKIIGNDLRKQEAVMLSYLLYRVFQDSYYKSIYLIGKYKLGDNSNVSKLSDITINKVIDKKIDNKNNTQRNKTNKEKFINKSKNNIKKHLKAGKSIEDINKSIDKDFNIGVNDSDKLIDNEIGRVFNEALMQSYKDSGIKKVMWISELEKNTCSECSSLHGEVFDLEEAPIPIEDTHVLCKCILVGVV